MGSLKLNIREAAKTSGISLRDLSRRANMNLFALLFMVYCPFSRIKLSQFVVVSRALKMQMSDLL